MHMQIQQHIQTHEESDVHSLRWLPIQEKKQKANYDCQDGGTCRDAVISLEGLDSFQCNVNE